MSLTYENDLWDGSKIVWDRFLDGKQLMKGVLEFLKERISYEEQYSKSVQKLAKISDKSVEGRSSESIPVSFSSMRLQADAASKEHQLFASNLNQNIYLPLKTLREEQSKTHKQLEADIKKLIKDLDNQKSSLNKAKTKFHSLSKDSEMADTAVEKGEAENVPAKEIAKLKTKAVGLQKQAEAADETYRGSIAEFQAFQIKYEEEMKAILKQYQQLEEQRNESLKELMEKFQAISYSHSTSLVESLSTIKQKVDIIDGKSDMQSFLTDKQTNQKPPPPVQYEPYIPLNPNRRTVSSLPVNRGAETDVSPAYSQSGDSKSHATISPVSSGYSAPSQTASHASIPVHQQQQQQNYNNESSRNLMANQPPANQNVVQVQQQARKVSSSPLPVGMETSATSMSEDYDMPSLPKPLKARANYDYTADEPNELTFNEGQIIIVDKMDASGWWHGSVDGRKGLFPGNYCNLLPDDQQDSPQESPRAVDRPAVVEERRDVAPVQQVAVEQPVRVEQAATPAAPSTERKVVVSYDFAGQTEDELQVKEGDILFVENESEGWLLARDMKGERGLVPANYTEPL